MKLRRKTNWHLPRGYKPVGIELWEWLAQDALHAKNLPIMSGDCLVIWVDGNKNRKLLAFRLVAEAIVRVEKEA